MSDALQPPACSCGCTCCGEPVAASPPPGWWAVALRPAIRRRARATSLLVGTLLVLINSGDKLLLGQWQQVDLWRVVLTYLVPYAVATAAAVGAIRNGPCD